MDKPPRDREFIIDELTAVCNSLGKMDENDGTYMKDRDCKPCLREMLRYLSSDSRDHTARCILGSLNVIRSDLIPLMVQYCDFSDGDSELFTIILRLSTNLTASALVLFENQEVPAEPDQLQLYNQLLRGLYGFKTAFSEHEKFWSFINEQIRHHIDDEIMFERLIILVRNILQIPININGLGINDDVDVHDMCLYLMEKTGVLTTLIHIASETQKGTEYCFHIIEIIYFMLRDQNPETLAHARPPNSCTGRGISEVDKKRMAELSARNRRERQARLNKFTHPRFRSSAFVVRNAKTLGSDSVVVSVPLGHKETIQFDQGKKELRKSKNRKPLSSETFMSVSDTNDRRSNAAYGLKIFCQQFIEKIYNNYMQHIKHNLIQKKAQDEDEAYYLWAIQFFSAFSRTLHLNIDKISETLSSSCLHYIQILITNYQDRLKLEKKKFSAISKRLHLALRAYREILYLIKHVEPGSDYAHTVESIQKHIFTETEYISLLLNLFQQYDEPKHSTHYLRDLVQTNQVFLDILEEYSNTHGPVRMDDDDSDEAEEEAQMAEEEAQIEEERAKKAGENAQEAEEGTGKVRGDPEEVDEIAGKASENDGTVNDYAKETDVTVEKASESAEKADDNAEKADENAEKADEGAEKFDDFEPVKKIKKAKKRPKKRKRKADFRAVHFMSRYCCPDVIRSHLKILKSFKTNDDQTNLAVLKFFERIVFDCQGEVFLFHVSVFKVLLDIKFYHSSLPGKDRFDALIKHLLEKFGSMANKKRWMYQELLFWKTANDVHEIELAVDPPPVMAPANEDLEDLANCDRENPSDLFGDEHNPPTETIADLLAELNDGDEDDDEAVNKSRKPAGADQCTSKSPADSIEDLLAELGDDPVSPTVAVDETEEPTPRRPPAEQPVELNDASSESGSSDSDFINMLIDIPDGDELDNDGSSTGCAKPAENAEAAATDCHLDAST